MRSLRGEERAGIQTPTFTVSFLVRERGDPGDSTVTEARKRVLSENSDQYCSEPQIDPVNKDGKMSSGSDNLGPGVGALGKNHFCKVHCVKAREKARREPKVKE